MVKVFIHYPMFTKLIKLYTNSYNNTTLQLHYNAVIGVHGEKNRVIYMRQLFILIKIVKATSFPSFHISYTPVYKMHFCPPIVVSKLGCV